MVGDVADRMRGADVFALATRADNLPIAVLEAMSLALPVVTTRVGGLPELVAEGTTGFLVEPDDSNALADAIRRLAQDEELRVRLGRAGAERVEHQFERDRSAREMVALYHRVAGASL